MPDEDSPEHNPRAAIVTAMVELDACGLNHGTAGNISVRTDGGFLITPSGVPADRLRVEQIDHRRYRRRRRIQPRRVR